MRLLKDSYYHYIASERSLLATGCSCRIMTQYANGLPDNMGPGYHDRAGKRNEKPESCISNFIAQAVGQVCQRRREG